MSKRLKMVLVVGIGGTGKSTLARTLAENLGLIFVDSEAIKASVGEHAVVVSDGESRRRAYKKIYDELFRFLNEGKSVITDAPHLLEVPDKEFLEKLETKLKDHGIVADVKIIWLKADEHTLRQTFLERKRPADLWKLDNWAEFHAKELGVFHVPHPHLSIQRPGYNLEEVEAFISE